MLASPLTEFQSPSTLPRTALALSLALHILVVLAWLGFPTPERRPDEAAMSVELTPAPEPAKAKPSDAPLGQGAETTGAASEGKVIPQLEEGGLAAHSSPPKARPALAPPAPNAVVAPKKPAPVSQNERDFVLSQVIRHWHPPRELAAYDKADVSVAVIVDANGYFDEDFDARRPWNPARVFDGYNSQSPQSLQRRSVDAFYQAIRKAQPVRLPPALKAKAPFPVRLDFRFKDAR